MSFIETDQRRITPAEVRLDPGEVRVIESHHGAGFSMQMDSWPFHKFCWVAVGRGRLEHRTGAEEINRGNFLLLPAGWAHRFLDDPRAPLTLVIFCISDEFLSSSPSSRLEDLWRQVGERYGETRVFRAKTGFHDSSILQKVREALWEQSKQNTGWRLLVQNTVLSLFVSICRGHIIPRVDEITTGRQSVLGAIEYVDQHPAEVLRIEEMAERCRLSPRRFTDLFRECTGLTFTTYLNRKKIEYACERLRETGHILYACHESGFNDTAYFYRVFKKETGSTPGQYLAESARVNPTAKFVG